MNARVVLYILLALVMAVSWAGACVIYRAAEVGELIGPLAVKDYARPTLVAVGTGSKYENPERLGPSTAVGLGADVVLVDAGRGMAEALRGARIPVSQPGLVLLTSLMPENVQGLDDLLLTGWLDGRSEPLRVAGPPGTIALAEALTRAHAAGIASQARALGLPPQGASIEASEPGDGETVALGGIEAAAVALASAGSPSDGLAWRFGLAGKRILVAGVGWAAEALVEAARGHDVLVHEAVYIPDPEELEEAGVVADPERLAREAAIHTPLTEVGSLAERARVKTLVLTRMRPPPFFALQVTGIVGESFHGEVLVPADGDEIGL